MRRIDIAARPGGVLAGAIAALFASVPVHAQQQEGAGEVALEEVVVTGSRIARTEGMLTPVPVTSVTLDELQAYEPGGTMVEQLSGLHQLFSSASTQQRTGAFMAGSGSSTVNLRNLGQNRTLILFDGFRTVPNHMSGTVDVDGFPTALMRSVDIVTGGASAAYGADALGGVVNFVPDRQFEGLTITAGTGITERGDGHRWNASIAGGLRLTDRMHFIGSVQANEMDQISRPQETLGAWWQNWGHVTNPEWSPGAPEGVPQRLTMPWVSPLRTTPMGVLWGRAAPGIAGSNPPLASFALNGYTFTEDGTTVRPLAPGDVVTHPWAPGSTHNQSGGSDAHTHNRASDNGPSGRETRSRHFFGALQYEFTDNLSGFAQVIYGTNQGNVRDDRAVYSLNNAWHATIFRDNAFLPEEVGAAMDAAGLESVQLHKAGAFVGANTVGTLGDGFETFDTLSGSLGADARLPNGWNLRFAWQSGTAERDTRRLQNRVDRMILGMDAVRDPETGAIVCRVQLFNPTEEELANTPSVQGRESAAGGPLRSPVGLDNTIRDCVPYNIMGSDGVSQSAQEYMRTFRADRTTSNMHFGEVLLSGELMQGWTGPIFFAVGATWREQDFAQNIDSNVYEFGPALNAPELGIRGVPPGYEGGSETLHRFTSARDASGDMRVWEAFTEIDVPIWESGVDGRRADANLSFRTSDYSRSGRADSWKMGVDFQVLEDVRLRVTRSRDVREPSFMELFNNRGGGGATIDDPITNSAYLTTSNPAGNPNLNPEVGDTIVAGFVYEPRWLSGLQLSADYYEVRVSDMVGSLSPQRIVDGCYLDNVQSFCQQIDRDPESNLIRSISNGYLNVDASKVEGVDFEVRYAMQPNFVAGQTERISLRLLGGYLMERSDTPLGGTPNDVAGSVNNPKLNGTVSLSYDVGRYGVQLQQRYIDSTTRNLNWVEGVDVDYNKVASSSYTNVRLRYEGDALAGASWNAALNVTNLFDRMPPLFATNSGQSIPNGRDQYGRRYNVTLGFRY